APASPCSVRLSSADDGCLHLDGILTNSYTTSRDSAGATSDDVARNRGCSRRRREDSSAVSGRPVLAEAASQQLADRSGCWRLCRQRGLFLNHSSPKFVKRRGSRRTAEPAYQQVLLSSAASVGVRPGG